MKTQEFLNVLKENKSKALLFEYQENKFVDTNYHITEVKNTAIHSVDCGGRADQWNETVIQLWESPKEKGKIERICIPFDFGPSRRYKDKESRFHFYDLDSPEGNHNLSILPSQIITIEILKESFSPKDYIKWKPNWFIKRNWGKLS